MEGSLLHFTPETEHHEICRQKRSNLSAFDAAFCNTIPADMDRLDFYSFIQFRAFASFWDFAVRRMLRKFAERKGLFAIEESFDPI